MAQKILITHPLPLDPHSVVPDGYDVVVAKEGSDWRTHLANADALVSLLSQKVGADEFDAASLKVVANYAVGFDNIDVEEASKRGIWVCNTPDVLTNATADLAMTLLLSAARRVREGERLVRSGEWKGWHPSMLLGADLDGKTLGIYGYGRIGQAMAKRARAFGMKVIFNKRSPFECEDEQVSFDELCQRSDVISLHAPYNEQSAGVFSRERLFSLKPGMILINTARGKLIDEAALVDALESGPIRAAGLDVFEHEPKIHPGLLEREDVVILPHLGSATEETRAEMAKMVLSDVVAVLEGKAPRFAVAQPQGEQ